MTKQMWVVLHHHRHGVDAYPWWGHPSEKEAIGEISWIAEYEPDRGEYLDWAGPFEEEEIPTSEAQEV